MPEDRLSLIVDTPGSQSIKDLRDAYKQLKAEVSQLPIGSAEFKEGAAQAGALNSQIKDLNYQMNGMSGAVRSARTEFRMYRFAVVELIGGFEGIATGIDQLTGGTGEGGAFKTLTKSMTGALGAGMGIKFGMDMLGGTFAKLSGPVALAVGALTLLGGAMAEEKNRLKLINDELTKNYDLRVKLSGVTEAESNVEQARQYNAAQVQSQQAGSKRLMFSFGNIYQGKNPFTWGKDPLEQLQGENAVLAAKVAQKENDALQAQWDAYQAKWNAPTWRENFTGGRPQPLNRPAGSIGNVMDYGAGLQPVGGVGMQSFAEANLGGVGPSAAESFRDATRLPQVMQNGFRRATDELARGLEKALNIGNNLAGQLLSTILQMGLSLGANYLTGGFSNLLSGQAWGGGATNSIGQSARFSGGTASSVVVHNNFTADGMATIVTRGNRILDQRSY
jgi:hypothetical protein